MTRKRVLNRRLLKLKDHQLLNYKYLPPFSDKIVILDSLGAAMLAEKHELDILNIRTTFPKANQALHDILVASTARKLSQDFSEIQNMDLDSMIFEHYLKKIVAHKGKKKGIYYPDYSIAIVSLELEQIRTTYNVEIVRTLNEISFKGKLLSQDETFMVIAVKEKMVNTLYDYAVGIKINKEIFLTTEEAFFDDSFLDVQWLHYPSGRMVAFKDVINTISLSRTKYQSRKT